MSRLDDAIDELYGADLDQFVLRRKQLAVDAKAAGDKDAAAAILALRKPTQSAFTVNRLSRTDGHAIDELMELGTELQHAQRGADAATLRELNRRRRALLSELTTRAFDVIGQQSPTTGQREEVSATLQAALADPDLAAQLRAGRLVKAAESSGFGFSPPDLTLLLSPAPQRPDAGAPGDRSSPPAAPQSPPPPPTAINHRAAAAERKAAAREKAREVVAAADAAVQAAVDAIETGQQAIRSLQRQLTDAKRELERRQKTAKDAELTQRKAREALNKLGRG